MNALSDQQKFLIKVGAVLAVSFGGWLVTLSTWQAGMTPIAIGGLLLIFGSQLGGILGITSPAATRAVNIALQPGVHTQEQVDKIMSATAPGTMPTPEVTAAILGNPPPTPKPPTA